MFIKFVFTVTSSIASIGLRNCNSNCLLTAGQIMHIWISQTSSKVNVVFVFLMNLPTLKLNSLNHMSYIQTTSPSYPHISSSMALQNKKKPLSAPWLWRPRAWVPRRNGRDLTIEAIGRSISSVQIRSLDDTNIYIYIYLYIIYI